MRILADFHHGDLFESLQLLFEKRLGWELYRPIGLEWFQQKYWGVWDHEATARQFLSLELTTEWESIREIWLNGGNKQVGQGIFHIPDPNHGSIYKGITLDAAKQMNFDIVLSSMPQHFDMFERFRLRHCPRAHHIFQMGNVWGVPPGCKNVLNSTTSDTGATHAVQYHQEFNLKEFSPAVPADPKSVTNLMHYQHTNHCYSDFVALRDRLPNWKWLDHGNGNEHGPVLAGQQARVINEAGFIFHCKRGGEGFGYNLHYAFACGRPMVVRRGLYESMVSAPLFDNTTCIDIDILGHDGAAAKMVEVANNWSEYSDNVQRRFAEVVNFDAEFIAVKSFLENLR